MGCYGIGINRIMASAIELYNDANGIIWPISIAPYEVILTTVNQEDPEVSEAADKLYDDLKRAGVDVLYDDRDLRAGVKFKDADLIGIPVRVTVGKKALAERQRRAQAAHRAPEPERAGGRGGAESHRVGRVAQEQAEGIEAALKPVCGN